MRSLRVLAVLPVVALGSVAAPADASYGTVTVTVTKQWAPANAGLLVVCHQHSDPPPGYVNFQSLIVCVVDNVALAIGYEGPDAVGFGVHAGSGPATVCVSGSASYTSIEVPRKPSLADYYDLGCETVTP